VIVVMLCVFKANFSSRGPWVSLLVSSYSPTWDTPRYPFGFHTISDDRQATNVGQDAICV